MTLYLVFGGTSRQDKRINLDLEPCPTIMADGIGGGMSKGMAILD